MRICINQVKAFELPALQMRLTSAFGVQDFIISRNSQGAYLWLGE